MADLGMMLSQTDPEPRPAAAAEVEAADAGWELIDKTLFPSRFQQAQDHLGKFEFEWGDADFEQKLVYVFRHRSTGTVRLVEVWSHSSNTNHKWFGG